jgi:Kef-type K+ transport system membrane component KefB
MEHPDSSVLLTLGLLLALALFWGKIAVLLRLPQVTAYLFVGIVLGPSLLNLVPQQHVVFLEPLTELAVALVLFSLGCQFPLNRARRIFRRVARLSAGELLATLLAVTLGLWLMGQPWEIAVLLGTLALATAPATTVLVLKETESEGVITEYAQALVAVNNFVAIVAFEIVFLSIDLAHGAIGTGVGAKLAELARNLAGSLGLGLAAGLIISYCFGLVGSRHRLVFLVAMATSLLGLCNVLDTSYMLTFLATGFITANTCYFTRHILAELDRLTGLLCVVFFATSGVELEISALMNVGLIGLGYVVLRCAGKYFGVFLAAERQHEQPVVRRWLGVTLVSQAGAAIALAAIATERDAELGRYLQTIILGTVPFFEVAGPILIRQAVLRAGEVPLAYAIPHTGTDLLEQSRVIWNRALLAFGFDPWHRHSNATLTVQQVMRKNVRPLQESFTFEEVLSFIEHSRDNAYPVVNAGREVVGVIRYRELSHALVDRTLGTLVRAADVATSVGQVLYPDEPVQRAMKLFRTSKDDCLPVIARDDPHQMLGIVRRRDILRLLIRRQSGSNDASH